MRGCENQLSRQSTQLTNLLYSQKNPAPHLIERFTFSWVARRHKTHGVHDMANEAPAITRRACIQGMIAGALVGPREAASKEKLPLRTVIERDLATVRRYQDAAVSLISHGKDPSVCENAKKAFDAAELSLEKALWWLDIYAHRKNS